MKCTFRPRSFAEAEMGCPLDHCGFCGGHVDAEHSCRLLALSLEHDRMFAATGEEPDPEFGSLSFRCGQEGCPHCEGPGEEDPMGSLSDYE